MFQFHTATHVMILGSSLDEQKIYRHDLPLNKSNSCSKNIRCNPLKNHIACNAFITSSLSLSLFDLIIVFTVSCEPTHLKTCIWENWNGFLTEALAGNQRTKRLRTSMPAPADRDGLYTGRGRPGVGGPHRAQARPRASSSRVARSPTSATPNAVTFAFVHCRPPIHVV